MLGVDGVDQDMFVKIYDMIVHDIEKPYAHIMIHIVFVRVPAMLSQRVFIETHRAGAPETLLK